MNPREKIIQLLDEIEKEKDFTILFAVESGSRLWRMADEKSDYDVRFVYFYPHEKYLSLRKPKDVFEKTFELEEIPPIDVVGFDIYKYLGLLLKSNPNSIDWLFSDLIYKTTGYRIIEALKELIEDNYNQFSLAMAYRSIGINAFKKIKETLTQQVEKVTDPNKKIFSLKKLLYVLRGLLNGLHILTYNELPFFDLDKTVEYAPLSNQMKYDIKNLIENKREGAVIVSYGEVEHIMNFIIDTLNSTEQYKSLPKKRISDDLIEVLDKLIYRITRKPKNF